MPIIIGFLGIALWMRIATIMEPVFGRKKWINLLADNTFSIMENQFLGFLLVKVAFGTIANGTKLFLKFDWSRCKSDICVRDIVMVVEFLWTLRNGFRMRESIWRCLLFVQDIFLKMQH